MSPIGIRREDKNPFERRVALTPKHVRELADTHQISVVVQPAPRRIYPDAEYAKAGATVEDNLGACPVILGIKEIPNHLFLPEKAYVFFSHTIKGQPHNMAMLRRILDADCTLIDYEKITDSEGRRLIFFGRHAGLAGMIETLHALGMRLRWEGIETPLAKVKRAYEYSCLPDAAAHMVQVGQQLAGFAMPEPFRPLVVGLAGYGNVSGGAQEILALLNARDVPPAELHRVGPEHGPLVKSVFREEDLVEPVVGQFDLNDYYEHPERYRSVFSPYLEQMHALVNCIYWSPEYPRLVTNKRLRQLYADDQPKLRVIGDISCDVGGSVEATVKATGPGNPSFVYEPLTDQAIDGVQGHGPVIMSVENLPAELPREASETFSNALMPFVPALAGADFTVPFEELNLPAPLKRATVAHRGALTPDYEYLAGFLPEAK